MISKPTVFLGLDITPTMLSRLNRLGFVIVGIVRPQEVLQDGIRTDLLIEKCRALGANVLIDGWGLEEYPGRDAKDDVEASLAHSNIQLVG